MLASEPISELKSAFGKSYTLTNIVIKELLQLSNKHGVIPGRYLLKMNTGMLKSYQIKLSNLNEELLIGYDSLQNQYYIDHTRSGKVDFNQHFPGRFVAPRLIDSAESNITLVVDNLVVDNSSVELFADGGLTVMSEVFFFK